MSKQFYLILSMSVVLLFVLGCTPTETSSASSPFLGGVNGLQLKFLADAPPAEAYDSGSFPFDVVVMLENIGEKDIKKEDCLVTLSGIDPTEFDKTSDFMKKHPEEDIMRRYKDSEGNIIDGGIVYVEYTKFNHKVPLTGNTVYPIRADVCYAYGTTITSMLCIKEDVLDVTDTAVCTVNENKQVFNSGAPVQVTSFKEFPKAVNKIGFTFKVKHAGAGEIFKKATTCSAGLENENKIWVEVDTGMTGLSCSGLSDGTETSGFITLYSGTTERTVTCSQNIANPGNQVKPVTITMLYDYKDKVTTSIIVKHSTE